MVFHLTYLQTFLTGSSLLRAAALAVALVRASAVLWAGRTSFQQPVHHWHPTNSNRRAIHEFLFFL
jgi:hypothetical protein